MGAKVASRPECAAADFDGDGVVGGSDFFTSMRPSFGSSPGPGPGAQGPSFTLDDISALSCSGGAPDDVCSVTAAPGLALSTVRRNVSVNPDSSGFTMRHEVAIPTPAGDILLSESELIVQLAGSSPHGGVETLRGRSRLPFPTVGFLAAADVTRQPMVDVGLDLGDNLIPTADGGSCEDWCLDAPIRPERHYFFFKAQAGFEAEIAPITFSTPGGSLLMVLDPTDPFFYVNGSVEGMPVGKNQDTGESEDASGGLGFGLSNLGLIPFDPEQTHGDVPGIAPFDGHFVQEASGPLGSLPLSLEGTVVYDLDPDDDGDNPFTPVEFVTSPDLHYAGNGVLSVGVPFLDVFSLGFELGSASVSVEVSESSSHAAFTGFMYAGLDSVLPAGLPIPINPQTTLEASGFLGEPIEDSFYYMRGEYNIDATVLGDLLGMDLNSLYAQQAKLRIDRNGFLLEGSTTSQIHPDIALGGAVLVRVWIPTDGSPAYIELIGDMMVFGTGLQNVILHVGTDGFLVNGEYVTPLSRIAMTGTIDEFGPDLTGSALLDIDLAEITGILDDIADGAVCAAETVSDAALCGTEAVTNGAVCGYETVKDAGLCGTDIVHNYAICSVEGGSFKADAVLCGTRQITDAAICGVTSVWSGCWKDACKWGVCVPYWDPTCALKNVAKSCTVAKECCETPKSCTDLTKPRTCQQPKTCVQLTECQSNADVPQLDVRFTAAIDLQLGVSGIGGSASATLNGTTLTDADVVFQPLPEVCVEVSGKQLCLGF